MKIFQNKAMRQKLPILDDPHYPWANEPDSWDWFSSGFRCYIARIADLGHYCGYVEVTNGHPLSGKDEDELNALLLPSHWGITFAGKNPKIPSANHGWWIGFDCGHCDDLTPMLVQYFHRPGSKEFFEKLEYRDFEYVKGVVEELAASLKALEV